MKRASLFSAVTLLLAASSADATVTLAQNGLGQGLLFPFFTTQHGQTTLLNVQNQSGDAKALKVRIMEAHSGAETLTFNVYVPPYGRWSAALAAAGSDKDAPATIIDAGLGCTVPRLSAPEPLRTYGFAGDEGPQTPGRTRRGYVEVVEMGTLLPTLGSIVFDAGTTACNVLVDRMAQGGAWDKNPNTGLGAPSGALRGDAILMDTAEGTSFGYPALAFDGLATMPRQFKLQGNGADQSSPRLSDIPAGPEGDIRVSTRDSTGAIVSLRYLVGEGYRAISALLASNSAMGMYNVQPDLAARSEWVISYPTKRDHHRAKSPPFDSTLHCDTIPMQMRSDDTLTAGTFPVDTCGVVSALKVYSDINRVPIVFRDDGTSDDGDVIVNSDPASGNIRLHFSYGPDFTGRKTSAPDLDGKCWAGMPVWVWQVQTYDNMNAQPGRFATFPESRVASPRFELTECSESN